MVFSAPSYIPSLPFPPPDSIPVHEFLFKPSGNYGRYPVEASKPPFTCGITGRSFSALEVASRIEHLARALATRIGCSVNKGHELGKVISIFSVNTVDSLTLSWATHRLNGVSNHISTTYTTPELAHQLARVKAKALFTCLPLLDQALEAAADAGIPREHVYILQVPTKLTKGAICPSDLWTLDQLIEEGKQLEPLPQPRWTAGQGARQVAFLCASSGTSGLPKNVMLSHQNVIATMLQFATHESTFKSPKPENSLGLLPLSHNLALMAVAHVAAYRGGGVIILPGFDLLDLLQAIEDYRIGRLWLVPPILTAMIKAKGIVRQYDISSVNTAVVGASSLSKEVASQFDSLIPGCNLVQGYGLTETTVAVTLTNPKDDMFCSCGHLFPGCEGRLIDENGRDIFEYDRPGELVVRAPTIMLGYLDNEKETKATLTDDGWLHTGDLVEFRKSPNGHDHMFIIDRIKELIKVRGMQVSPTEVENFLLRHPKVGDISIVPVPDDAAGELPLAFVVKSKIAQHDDEEMLRDELHAYLNQSFAVHKRLAGGIEFIDSLPKTGSGKTQRKVLKALAKSVMEARNEPQFLEVEIYNFDSDDELIEDDFETLSPILVAA